MVATCNVVAACSGRWAMGACDIAAAAVAAAAFGREFCFF
jgi:hypothetical protein